MAGPHVLVQSTIITQWQRCHRVSGAWNLAFGEARVAADAIGLLEYIDYRRCVAAPGKILSTSILRRYAA